MKSVDNKRPLKVFLCHASADKPKVRELYRYLRRRGINPWFDEEHLVGGQDWQIEIPKALATSDAIIICLTKNSVDKEGYIQKEIKFALDKALEMPEGKIFLIPVKFEECEVPFALSRYQWVDLTIEAGYTKMMKALKFRASQLERNTVQLPKNDIDEDKLTLEKEIREKQERQETEKIVRERIEKETREKKAREAIIEKAKQENKEREKTALKKKIDKPTAVVKPKANSQITYWVGGIFILVLGIILLFSIDNFLLFFEPKATNTATSTPTSTFEPTKTLTKIKTPTLTLTNIPTITPSPTSTALFLTFCTWQEILNGELVYNGKPIKYIQYEFNCNDSVCSGNRVYYDNEGGSETLFAGLWGRDKVNQNVQTGNKGKCTP
ncbi:MAG: TIR domain-containing protein [Anaerolineales bacterium]|nr:TIR domain-containing protein [Anaerolineales bacterium]